MAGRRGITLVEIILAIALIGMATGICARLLSGATSDERQARSLLANIIHVDRAARATARSGQPVEVQLDGEWVVMRVQGEEARPVTRVPASASVELSTESSVARRYRIDARGTSKDLRFVVVVRDAVASASIAGLTGDVSTAESEL